MRKYVAAALLELKSIHAYRLNWTLSVLCELIPLAGALVFWQAFFGERAEPLYGYASQEVTTYYFLAAVLTGWVPTVWYEVSHNILSGTLDVHLARPIGYSRFYLTRQLASNAYFLLWTAGLMLPVVLAKPSLVAGPASFRAIVFFVGGLVLGYVLEYTLQVAIRQHLRVL